MSKYLIVFAHPSHEGHSGYLLAQIKERLEKARADFEIIDLYQLNYDPTLKMSELYSADQKEVTDQNLDFQNKIKVADRLLFIYPTWWQNMPAILKGFIDRVFTSGFGFIYFKGIPIGQLKNKKAAAFTSSGGPAIYTRFFTNSSSLRILLKHVLGFCGMQTEGFLLGNARKLEDNKERLNLMADKILAYLK